MNDEQFFVKLLATFRLEADEHIKALSDGLMELEKDLPEDQRQKKIEDIFREAHNLKGAARAVNQSIIERICQALENVLADLKKGLLKPSRDVFDILHSTLDFIGLSLDKPPEEEAISEMIKKLEAVRNNSPSIKPLTQNSPPPPLRNEIKKEDIKKEEIHKDSSASTETDSLESKSAQSKETKEKSIRVSLLKMNLLFQELEELLMVKLVSQQQVGSLKQLQLQQTQQIKELNQLLTEIQVLRQSITTERENKSHQEALKKVLLYLDKIQREAKPSRDNLNQLIKVSEQNSHFVDSVVDTLIEDMKKILMQPLSTLFELMPRMIRSIAHELKKEIQVEFQGGEIEIDRRILEEIKDSVIHLLRNAIDHGIESPEEREQAQKNPSGTIKIIARESEGNCVALSIADDGRGIDVNKLKIATIKQKVISQKEADELTDEEVIKLAFHAGVSTSSLVSEISGRGLGLGIVSEKIDRLGGQIVVDSKFKEGTKITLLLPLTLATFRGIHVTVAGQEYIMPTFNVKRVLRVKNKEIQTVANQDTIVIDSRSIPYIHLADILGLTRTVKSSQKSDSFNSILLVSAADKTIAFGVDVVLQEQEILVKGLGKQCVRVKNFMAATVMEWGKVIPILNPIDLIRSSIKGKISSIMISDSEQEVVSSKKEVLLAEDSITTRLLLKNIVESAGYDVKTAVDGLEAWEMLRSQPFSLLLTDIEMPRMDGFALVKKIKEVEELKDLPIIICTSKGSKEDKEQGINLGADAYLDKSRFSQQELISIIKNLL